MSNERAELVEGFANMGTGLAAMHKAMVGAGMGHEDALRVVQEYVRAMVSPKPPAASPPGLFGSSA